MISYHLCHFVVFVNRWLSCSVDLRILRRTNRATLCVSLWGRPCAVSPCTSQGPKCPQHNWVWSLQSSPQPHVILNHPKAITAQRLRWTQCKQADILNSYEQTSCGVHCMGQDSRRNYRLVSCDSICHRSLSLSAMHSVPVCVCWKQHPRVGISSIVAVFICEKKTRLALPRRPAREVSFWLPQFSCLWTNNLERSSRRHSKHWHHTWTV